MLAPGSGIACAKVCWLDGVWYVQRTTRMDFSFTSKRIPLPSVYPVLGDDSA